MFISTRFNPLGQFSKKSLPLLHTFFASGLTFSVAKCLRVFFETHLIGYHFSLSVIRFRGHSFGQEITDKFFEFKTTRGVTDETVIFSHDNLSVCSIWSSRSLRSPKHIVQRLQRFKVGPIYHRCDRWIDGDTVVGTFVQIQHGDVKPWIVDISCLRIAFFELWVFFKGGRRWEIQWTHRFWIDFAVDNTVRLGIFLSLRSLRSVKFFCPAIAAIVTIMWNPALNRPFQISIWLMRKPGHATRKGNNVI